MTKKKHGSSIQKRLIPSYIFLVIVSFISVFPFFWMISAATNKSIDVARGRIAFGGYALENLKKLFASQNVALGMKNSLINATVQTIIALLVCSLAGYGFELYHDKAKDKLFSVLLLAMMIPKVATLIPLFKMMSKLGFINTVWGFMLPAISTPFLIMMFRQNSRNFPIDIMEAARIDGLSEIGIFFIQVASQTAYGLLRSYPRYLKYWEQQVRDKYLQTQSQSSLANKTGQYYQLIREQQAVAQKKNHTDSIVGRTVADFLELSISEEGKYYDNSECKVLPNSRYGLVTFVDLGPQVQVSSRNNILLTRVQGRDYTRKEYISGGDLEITINGKITSKYPDVYPEAEVSKFIRLVQ